MIIAASVAVGAFGLPGNSGDAAILATLSPGDFTALLGGTNPRAPSPCSKSTKFPKRRAKPVRSIDPAFMPGLIGINLRTPSSVSTGPTLSR